MTVVTVRFLLSLSRSLEERHQLGDRRGIPVTGHRVLLPRGGQIRESFKIERVGWLPFKYMAHILEASLWAPVPGQSRIPHWFHFLGLSVARHCKLGGLDEQKFIFSEV